MSEEKHWTPLHVHTSASTLDGIIRFKDLQKIKDKGIKTCAITDHGTLAGSYEFYKEAVKVGVKPIIGEEFYWTMDHKTTKENDLAKSRPNYHMILLAKNREGYQSLCKLSSLAYTEGFYYSPRIDDKMLEEYGKNIISTSACLGSLTSQFILNDKKNEALKQLQYYKDLFGRDNFFLELQTHDNKEQRLVNEVLMDLNKELKLNIIVTSDSHYLDCCDKALHDKFLAIGTKSRLDDPKRFTFHDIDCDLPSYSQLVARCSQVGIPEEAISNTNYIADMVTPDYFESIVNRYPSFRNLPEGFKAHEYLELLVKTKYLEQNDWVFPPTEVEARIDEELTTIKRMGYSDYMLIIWDIIERGAKSLGVEVGPGRGSCGSSYVAYILGITKVNSLKHGLMMSRFLNSGRSQIPIIF